MIETKSELFADDELVPGVIPLDVHLVSKLIESTVVVDAISKVIGYNLYVSLQEGAFTLVFLDQDGYEFKLVMFFTGTASITTYATEGDESQIFFYKLSRRQEIKLVDRLFEWASRNYLLTQLKVNNNV